MQIFMFWGSLGTRLAVLGEPGNEASYSEYGVVLCSTSFCSFKISTINLGNVNSPFQI